MIPYKKGYEENVDSYTYEYLPWRGITKETMEFYGVKTKIDSKGKPISLSFNYPKGTKTRLIDSKEFFTDGKLTGLFGRDKFDPLAHKSVTITEGELDALSAYQILGHPCVSVSSSSAALRDCTSDHSWLRDFETIYLCFDSDTPGKEATQACASLFPYSQIRHVRLRTELKDSNAYLQAGKEFEFKNIWYSSKNYLPETIKSSLSDFYSILETKPAIGIPYANFSKLTEMTYGIRPGETVLVTAREGVGKTEFLHAVEHSILRDTSHNVAGLFLEETPARHLQALAGISLQRPTHLPDSGCSLVEIKDAVKSLLERDDRLFLGTQFGSDDISHLLGNIRFFVAGGKCIVVFIDHVSLAVGSLEGDEQRRALDQFFTQAETMVKELNFSLVVVSHVNDFGQTRGSRWGGKMADIRIDLHRDVDNGSSVLDIYVSKNRFSGRTGHAGSYEFNPLTRCYTPVAENDNEPINQSKAVESIAA